MEYYRYATSVSVLALALSAQAAAQSTPDDDEASDTTRRLPAILVESQKVEENLQDVPIAVTALDLVALDRQQIDSFSDLQFNAPNVSYTKTSFSGNNFQIRGIGSTSTAASADSGVSMHVNDVYVHVPRIFETEYFDLERVELLRGPQGTLYGRNATGGVVNIITHKPILEEFSGDAAIQVGNYEHYRAKGAINIPVGDRAALRFAGIYLNRDGYIENVDPRADFDSINGRDQFALRGSFRWEPTDRTTIDLMASYFEEDDDRTRRSAGRCITDPTAILGCLPTGLAAQPANFSATFGGIFMSDVVLGAFGLFPYNTIEGNPVPDDLRQQFQDFAPRYFADETFVLAQVDHDLTNSLNVHWNVAYQDTIVRSNEFFGSPIGVGELTAPPLFSALFPQSGAFFFPNGQIPISDFDPAAAGSIAGRVERFTEGVFSSDQSTAVSEQLSTELRVSTSFDGPLNFLAGVYYLDQEGSNEYYVNSTALDYGAAVLGALTFGDGIALGVPMFRSDSDAVNLESIGIMGEAYWDVSDTVSITMGVRYTEDEKFVRDRTLPLLGLGPVPIGDGADAAIQNLINATFDADPTVEGLEPFREVSETFDGVTGRLVADWTPDLAWTDDTLVYASYSRGFKGGGFNPPVDPSLISGVPTTFDDEKINAYEIGTKNTIGNLQANVTGFFYDYSGLQVAKIQARTGINENVDAEIMGIESEFLWAPTDNLLFNLTGSYLSTEVLSFQSEDPRDPTRQEAGHILIKDAAAANNCLITNLDPAVFTAATGLATVDIPGLQSPGVLFSCGQAALDGLIAALQAQGLAGPDTQAIGGLPFDNTGNELQNSPEFSLSIGAQYTHNMTNGYRIEARADYYWQDEYWTRIFNQPATDLVDAWDMVNLQATLFAPDDRWHLRAFVQNLFDEDNVTGHAVGDQSTGLATTLFLVEPQLYGVELAVRF